MRSITLRNYRCFGEEHQTARLAPLTLLVGENSSGKTSLMAMVRALWNVVYDDLVPDFKQAPYDLGSFEEIAHHRGVRGSRADEFEAALEYEGPKKSRNGKAAEPIRCLVRFQPQWSAPVPVSRRLTRAGYWIEQDLRHDKLGNFSFGTPRGEWKYENPRPRSESIPRMAFDRVPAITSFLFNFEMTSRESPKELPSIVSTNNGREFTKDDLNDISINLLNHVRHRPLRGPRKFARVFASGPVRSQPERVYSYESAVADSVGDYIPTYLAQLALREPQVWDTLKTRLESFGKDAGLFDEVRVRHLGKTDSDPFQIQVRKFSSQVKGPFRNLVDVGYGISQILPVVTEILKDQGATTLLLQQPEVHLHPSAQAAVGSLLAEFVSTKKHASLRQVIVETHSDFIIDRIRSNAADRRSRLTPDDVSIVYFERDGLDVKLHSLKVDDKGNIEGAPSSYRQFFLDELQRSIGI